MPAGPYPVPIAMGGTLADPLTVPTVRDLLEYSAPGRSMSVCLSTRIDRLNEGPCGLRTVELVRRPCGLILSRSRKQFNTTPWGGLTLNVLLALPVRAGGQPPKRIPGQDRRHPKRKGLWSGAPPSRYEMKDGSLVPSSMLKAELVRKVRIFRLYVELGV